MLRHDALEANFVDLADFERLIYDEPQHPQLQQYKNVLLREQIFRSSSKLLAAS